MQAFQTLLAIPVHILGGVRWVVIAMVLANLANLLGADVPLTPWPVVITLFLVFVTAWGRMLISAGAARLLLAGLKPGALEHVAPYRETRFRQGRRFDHAEVAWNG